MGHEREADSYLPEATDISFYIARHALIYCGEFLIRQGDVSLSDHSVVVASRSSSCNC